MRNIYKILTLSLLPLTAANADDISVSQAGIAPVIDGIVDDIWLEADSTSLTSVVIGTEPLDLAVSVRFLWDDLGIYILIEVDDATLFTDSDVAWRDDSFSIYLDGDNSKNSLEDGYDGNDDELLFFRTGGDSVVSHKSSAGYIDVMDWSVGEVTGGYVAEVFIGWTPFPITPAATAQIGLDIQVNNDVDGGDSTEEILKLFDTVGNGWGNPSVFGTLELSSKVVGGPAEWNGYVIDEDGFVDTDDWLGVLYVVDSTGWAFSYDLLNWVYAPSGSAESNGWVYIAAVLE